MIVTRKLKVVLLSIVVWIGYLMVHFYFLNFPFDPQASLILAIRVVIVHIILFYTNYYLLLPRLLDKQRYFIYFIALALLIVITYILFSLSHQIPIIHEALETGRHHRFRGVPRLDRAFRSRMFINNIISSLAVLFISSTYWIIRRNQQRQQDEINLRSENLETEMKFLKSQINPHFLLNAMNNLYYMAVTKGEKTPDMLMKLSEMLKYVLYETNTAQVPLAREVQYIRDYIEFQQIKYESPPDIRLDLDEANGHKMISPMILIPFIENAFKHGNIDEHNGHVAIKIKTEANSLAMTVSNTHRQDETKDKTGGIGLENAKRRLDLIYKSQYVLDIKDDGQVFDVSLKINLQVL